MSDLKPSTDVSVFTDMDRIVLRINKIDIFIPYAQSFKIAQNIRVACKRAKSLIHESEKWDKLASDDNLMILDYSQVTPGHQMKGKFNWEVRMDMERIYLCLGDIIMPMHFVDALKISQWIRLAGKECKQWAGDSSKGLNGLGMLTDAEENYKLGLN